MQTNKPRYQNGQLIDDGERWCARWREDLTQANGSVRRVRRWEVLALKKGITRRGAERLLAERLSRMGSASSACSAPAERFADFAARWMTTVMIHHKPSTQQGEKSVIQNHLIPAFGGLALRDLGAENLQRWVSAQSGAANSVRNRLTVLKEMWTTAKAWGYAQHDPFQGLKKPAAVRGNSYYFSIEESLAILNAVPPGWKRLFVRVLAETGMRPGEAAGLRREDFDGRILKVTQSVYNGRAQNPKTVNAVRAFAISRDVSDGLRAHIDSTDALQGFLFANSAGNPVCMRNFQKYVLDPALEKTGIKARAKARGLKVGAYPFRHGNITELERRGVPLKTIQRRVGHSAGSDVTHLHYLHAVDADDLAAADMLGELLTLSQGDEAVQ